MNKYKFFIAQVIFSMAFILFITLIIKGCFNGEKYVDLKSSISDYCDNSRQYSSISDFCDDFRLDLKKNEFKNLKELKSRVTEWIDILEDSEDEILDGIMENLDIDQIMEDFCDNDGPDNDYYF